MDLGATTILLVLALAMIPARHPPGDDCGLSRPSSVFNLCLKRVAGSPRLPAPADCLVPAASFDILDLEAGERIASLISTQEELRAPQLGTGKRSVWNAELISSIPGAAGSQELALWTSSIALLAAVASVVGARGLTPLLRDWLWLRYCRYIYGDAVKRGLNPKPEQMIQFAGNGRPDLPPTVRS